MRVVLKEYLYSFSSPTQLASLASVSVIDFAFRIYCFPSSRTAFFTTMFFFSSLHFLAPLLPSTIDTSAAR